VIRCEESRDRREVSRPGPGSPGGLAVVGTSLAPVLLDLDAEPVAVA
jgi:hypothetical protein